MALIYLALGTNLGERARNLENALAKLSARVTIMRRSMIYETEPWGISEQPRFLNQVVEAETELEPDALLDFLKQTERAMGRTRGIRFGPRVIDLDILFYEDRVIEQRRFNGTSLRIPHPRLHERRFVLVPLAEIAPNLIHPKFGVSIRELLARLPDDGSVALYRPNQ